MIVDKDEKQLAEIAILLKKARIKANELPCMCEENITCGKHRIVDDITKAEKNVKNVLATF